MRKPSGTRQGGGDAGERAPWRSRELVALPVPAAIGRLARVQVGQTAQALHRRLRGNRAVRDLARHVALPDSHTAVAAVDLITEWATPALVAHSLRTFVYGSLLGARDGLGWDAEVLFVAAMLHDAALTGQVSRKRPFHETGGDLARTFCLDAGWEDERAELARRAIVLHLEVGLADRDRPEVALLHLGATVDVTGVGLNDLPPGCVADVLATYPRHDFKQAFAELLVDEAQRHPTSTTAFLCRWGQLPRRVKKAPFDS